MSGDVVLAPASPAEARSAPRSSFTLACGALGRFDRDRVLRLAAALGGAVAPAHEDARSILCLDRAPVRWEGGRARGYAWAEQAGSRAGGGVRSWHEAASGGACGLVVDGRRRILHSSVSGVGSLYYLRSGDALYFATRVDALVSTAAERLSVDWEAWAAILTLDYPLADRTPFAEVRLVPPFSTLAWRRGAPRVVEHRWPWAEVEAAVEVEEGTPEVLERMREAADAMPARKVMCQLSGGFDSRLALALFLERGRDVTTLTVDHDGGTDRELRVAAAVADATGVPHKAAVGRESEYWDDMRARSLATDYQLVRHPWRVPMIEPMRRFGGPVIDGFCLDAFAVAGERHFTPETLDPAGDGAVARALWRTMKAKQAGRGAAAFERRFAKALWSSARRQFLAESARWKGHAARAILTFYLTRARRGIALNPFGAIGAAVPVAAPFADDGVVRSLLAIRSQGKLGGHVYRLLFEAVDPSLWALPTTSLGSPPPGSRLPRRSQSATVAEAYLACIERGPLRDALRPTITHKLARHRREKRPIVPLAALGPAVFSLWHERYRQQLGDVDPRRLLE